MIVVNIDQLVVNNHQIEQQVVNKKFDNLYFAEVHTVVVVVVELELVRKDLQPVEVDHSYYNFKKIISFI